MKKVKARKAAKFDGPWQMFSVMKPTEMGMPFKHWQEMLESEGVTPVKRGYSPYVGQYGIQVPKKFEDKASKVLFG